MFTRFLLVPLLVAATAAWAQTPTSGPLADKATALRCAAVFGIVANEQARGVNSALQWPDLRVRGREFFVQLGARLMDEEGLDRSGIQARFKAEVDKLQNEAIASPDPAATVRAVMGPCLSLLDATVPADAGRGR